MYEYYHDTGLRNTNGDLLPCQTEHAHSDAYWDLLRAGSRDDWSLMGEEDSEEAPFDLRSMNKFIVEHTSSAEVKERHEDGGDANELPWLQSIIAASGSADEPIKLSGKARKAQAASEAKRVKDQKKAHRAIVDKQQDGWRK